MQVARRHFLRYGSGGLDLLILGGTGFIGPWQVRCAVERGHRVTIFTRGRRTAELPAGVTYLTGDRDGGLEALRGRRWDVVLDNSAANPQWVRQSAELLRGSAGLYLYVSSTGVYLPYTSRGIDESVEPRTVDDPDTGRADSYGVLKALCELEAERAFPGRAVIVRPHFIVGPGDTTDRFPYWPVRISRGGEVLAPGRRSDPVQFIDVRDLTSWMIRLVEEGKAGIFNAAGPRGVLTQEEFLYGVQAGTSERVDWTWIEDYDFLEAQGLHGVVPWILLRNDHYGMTSIRSDRAIAHGLTYRPLAETVRDTLVWWATVPEARRAEPRFALTPERESAILRTWKDRTGPTRS